METMTLTATSRQEMGRKTNALRAEGQVPAVVYGLDAEPKNIVIARNDFDRVLKGAGESTVIQLSIDGTEEPVLIQDIQRNPLTEFTTHVDFRRVDMNTAVETSIYISIIGVSPAVKDLGGTLIQSVDAIDVKALPSALVKEIEVDAAKITTFEDAIHISDLVLPEGIELLSDPEQTIATVAPPRVEEAVVVSEDTEGEAGDSEEGQTEENQADAE